MRLDEMNGIKRGDRVRYTSKGGRTGVYEVDGLFRVDSDRFGPSYKVRLLASWASDGGFSVPVDLVELVADEEPAAPAPRFVGDFGKLSAILTGARDRGLKFPKIRLQTMDGRRVELSLAGDRSRYPGTVNVTDGGRFGSNKWYGRINIDGTSGITDTGVLAILHEFAEHPAEVASLHGKVTGSCCFCRRDLETRESLTVGYGPVCAEKYGLPWGATPAGTLAEAIKDELISIA